MDDIRRLVEQINASGQFDANWYRREYPDVASLGIDPAEHYARWGRTLGRSYRAETNGVPLALTGDSVPHDPVALNGMPTKSTNGDVDGARGELIGGRSDQAEVVPVIDNSIALVDVVVPVYNALADVQVCLESVLRHDQHRLGELIVVNDGSDAATTDWLRSFCVNPKCRLIEHGQNRGYTRAVNTGLRASRAAFVVTLNSDTVVTPCWLEGMVRCMRSSPDIGIVGPLSNAASWQNVPELYGPDKQFAVNALPCSMSAHDMAATVRAASVRRYPRSPFLNGFCMMIRREVIDAIGVMDEERFPVGYGEENDFCVRASDAGFVFAVADDTYVFHAKSKSFGHEKRKELSAQGRRALEDKHGRERVQTLIDQAKHTIALDTVRSRVSELMAREPETLPESAKNLRVLFLLPVAGGSGGAHSVVQEALGMRRLGVKADVAVEPHRIAGFLAQYERVPGASDLFIECDEVTAPYIAGRFDVVVATIFTSVQMLKRIVDVDRRIIPAYYVQDYEPLFFSEGTPQWLEARASYGLVPSAVLFAKTRWIADKVYTEHGVRVHKVEASVDHSVYFPADKASAGRLHVVAMIRPQTPRRGAARTMRVLSKLARELPGRLKIHLFGVDSNHPAFIELKRDFDFECHGVLVREQVAALLAQSHVFVDLSDYQAFGRTAIEAMACGCAVVVPAEGGTDEFAVDGESAAVVDTTDEGLCFRRIRDLVLQPAMVASMAQKGLETAARYSVARAAASEIGVFSAARSVRRQGPAPVQTPELHLVPATNQRGGFTFPAYRRLLCPHASEAVRRKWRVSARRHGEPLPIPGTRGAVALLQRDVAEIGFAQLKQWAQAWRSGGGRLVYDLDEDLLDTETLSARGIANAAQTADRVFWLIQNADEVNTVTELLAERLRSINGNVTVVPDRLDSSLWQLDTERDHSSGPYARRSDVVRIGYIGDPEDCDDLQIVAPAMQQLIAHYGKRVEVEVIGAFQHRKPTFGTRVGLPRSAEYPGFVRWLQQRVHWDIGVIPMRESAFNLSRAPIRWLENAALNMAIVCSQPLWLRADVTPDASVLAVEESESAWFEALRILIEDPDRRDTLSSAARRAVIEHSRLGRQ